VGARFSAHVQTSPGAHPASYTMGTGSFPRADRQGCGVDHPPSSSADDKEYSYTSIPRLGLHGLLQTELCLYLYLYLHCCMSQVWVFLFSFSSFREVCIRMLVMHLDLPIGELSISVTLHG